MPAQIWEVVGGGDKGGILVREGQSLKSTECEGRLSTGALIEEVDLVGERLCYKRLTGSGPEDGWVSLTIKGKEIVTKTDKKPEKPPATEPGVKSDKVMTMIKERCDRELAKPPYEWKMIDMNLVMTNHDKKGKGCIYGMEFPWNEATLEEFGPEWLTKAFHTVGSMDKDNRVTKIILERKIKVTTGNNGGKFLFEVRYAKPDPDLHTKLFAKVPFPLSAHTKNDRLSSSVNKQPAELYEINAYRYLEATLPMKTPRFYFGDICNETSNWILITERIDFHDFEGNNFGKPTGEHPPPLPAYEIEGPYDKCIDSGNLRGDHMEYYLLMTRVGAKMAGLAKSGQMGSQELLSKSFRSHPDIKNPAVWGMNPQAASGQPIKQQDNIVNMSIDMMSDWAKQVFPPYVTSDAFKKKFKKTMNTMNAYVAEINYWMHMNEDYVALGHMNLNVDNAYFWRTPEGKLDCGVFDWGGMGTSSYGNKLWWFYYCADYEVLDKGMGKLCETFCEDYKASGGPQLDAKELEMMVIIAGLNQMPGLMAAVPQIIKMCPKKNWPEIKDRYDPRIALNVDDKSTLRTYLHCMNNIVRIIEEKNGAEVLESFVKDIYVGRMNQTAKTDAMING
eukprot:TRINITY_DN722_c0_g1_i4.p1 TRINITY_DN722_c0_g1~~TRINITY_DN722_c0_g1_i4.p1  ORF type:complete len:617 (-),score=122.63 TRINITY_DN722_c0_g1_i4:128-1978(-)